MATAKKTTAKAPAKAASSRSSKPSGTPAAKPAKAAGKTAPKPAGRAPKAAPEPARKQAAKKSGAPAKAAGKAATEAAAKPAGTPTKQARGAATPAASAGSARSSKPPTTTKAATTTPMSSAKTTDNGFELPKPKFNKDGLGYTKDFDLAFIKQQYDALQEERIRLAGQALRLEQEANELVEDAEMGDVKFDDEGGEGDTMAVERERDLALSAQAREAIAEIDAALKRIAAGTYGYSVVSGRPIPRERLEAIPWSSVLVEEKVGGIGRR